MNQDNPLLADDALPAFSRIRPEHVAPAIDAILADDRAAIAALAAPGAPGAPRDFAHVMLAQERPLSDTGQVADGYAHFLHIDERARAVYVIEQGGFAGTTKVYGPLPLPRCTPAAEAPAH